MTDQEKYAAQIKQALTAIKDLKSQLQQERNKQHEPIAVVGMAFRFPGNADSVEKLSELLLKNIDAIEDIPTSRYDNSKIYDADGSLGKSVLQQGGYLKNIDLFDAPFFDLTRIETESLDPQQRILLELTQEAIENAGLNTQTLVNSETGVFIGITSIDYQKKHFRSGDYNLVNPYSYTGSAVCANAGRISYTFGFQGPSVTVDTACSSSLVATHLAVQSLRKGESNLAIAGAVNLILEPELSICFTALSGLSKDSRCRPFSNQANGFVRSEGAAIIVLKRLNDAINDNDNILAVIKGTAVNQDGKSNGFTAPSVLAQTKLIQTAIKDAQLDPKDIEYIEAHGTGTKIGDPIELEALSTVFSSTKTNANPLHIASIKSNIGHTESVAGLAGLIKNILSINQRILPKNLHSEELNQFVDWESLPIKVVQENTTWQPENKFVGVSSFGVTGTNAHVILGHHQNNDERNSTLRNDIFILPISAKSENALLEVVKKYDDFIQSSNVNLEDICAMAALRRTHYKYRKTFVASSKDEILQQISDFLETKDVEKNIRYDTDDNIKTVFVFPGQGAQWLGMALNLMDKEAVFKESIDAFNAILKTQTDWDLIEILNSNDEEKFNQLDIIQPTLVAISIALSKLWQSKGVFPDAVIGHSLGEVAAAHIAGIISLEDAVKIICNRSKLMKQVSGRGLMLATDLAYDEALKRIENINEQVSVAVVNSNNSLVLSGDKDTIEKLANELEQEDRFARLIKVDVASHSVHMQGIDEQLKEVLQDVLPKNSNVEFYSSVYKTKIDGNNLNAEYWKQNLRQTVHFKDAITQILQQHQCVCIEMSPHQTLLHAIQQNIDTTSSKSITIASLTKEKNDVETFYKNLSDLYEHNIQIDFKNIYENINKFILLPNYAWQKERYWFDEQPNVQQPIQSNIKSEDISIDYIYTTKWEIVDINSNKIENKKVLLLEYQKSSNVFENIKSALINNNNSVDTEKEDSQIYDYIIICCLENNESKDDVYLKIEKLKQQIKNTSQNKHQSNIILLTSNAVIINNEKTLNEQACVLAGIFRTLRNEENSITFKHIDIDNKIDVENILNSLNTENKYSEIAIREHTYYVPKIISVPTLSNDSANNLDKDATILIVGGTSGLGLQLAIDYSNKGHKNIALVSRSGAKPETDEALDLFTHNNTKVAILKADYTNSQVVHDSIVAIEKNMPAIKTVVHAAAVLADGLFQDINNDAAKSILQPKLDIAKNIQKYFSDKNEVRLIFFSSAASVLGTLAQAVYSGANYFIDNFVNYINNIGGNAIAVNWGNIAEVGLAAQDDKRGKNLSDQGLGLIYKNELPKLFDMMESNKLNQIIPLKIDFNKWKETYKNTQQNILFSNFIEQKTIQIEDSVEKDVVYTQRNLDTAVELIQQKIKNHISTITKIPVTKLKIDETFKSLGVDSLMALQLKNKIQSDFNITLNVSSVWSYPTVEKYANYLSDELNLKEQYNQNIEQTTAKKNTIETEVDSLSLDELMKQLNDKL